MTLPTTVAILALCVLVVVQVAMIIAGNVRRYQATEEFESVFRDGFRFRGELEKEFKEEKERLNNDEPEQT